jgi:hypothetical protein
MLNLTLAMWTLLSLGGDPAVVSGDYYSGDGLGVNWSLELCQDGTFEFSWDGCLGNYDHQSGRWDIVDGLITFQARDRKPDGMEHSLPPSLRPVRWGERLYLIPPDELLDFCNEVNDGGEPRSDAHGLVLLRQDDWTLPVSGRPELPEPFQAYLLSEPVRGNLVKGDGERAGIVDRGSSQGLRPGMVLYSQGSLDLVQYRVISTSPDACVVEVIYDGDVVLEGPVSTLLWDETLRPKTDPERCPE